MARSKNVVTTTRNSTRVSLIRPDKTRRISGYAEMSLEMVRMFADQLIEQYTNPIAATVREVVSNAIDATVALPVDQRRPVEITSPSAYSPNFVVTDHGVGMSEDTVDKNFVRLGRSTKTDDMDMIGAKGLGAKAPLSYCNEFNVVTTHEGITTVVTCGRDENGIYGEILSVEETGKESGTVVTIPLKSHNDAAKFNDALQSFRNNPCDTTVLVDGVAANTLDFLEIGEVVLDADENLKGRVWLKASDALDYIRLISGAGAAYLSCASSYILSGWNYTGANLESHGYGRAKITLYVELLPGVVDFPSSRDEITRNDRFDILNKRVADTFLKNISDDTFKVVVKRLMEAPVDEYAKFNKELVNGYYSSNVTPNKQNVRVFLKDMLKSTIEDMRHSTGLNHWEMLDETLPKDTIVAAALGSGYYDMRDSTQTVFGAAFRNVYTDKISETVENVSESMSAGEASIRLLPTMTNNVLSGYTGNVAIVENATLEASEIIRRRRATIVKMDLFDSFFLLKGKLDKFTKDSLDTLGVSYTVESSDDFVKRIKEVRPPKAVAQASVPKQKVHFTRILDDGAKLESALNSGMEVAVEETDATVTTIAANNGVVLLSSGRSTARDYLLYGLLNDEIDLAGRPVYIVNGSSWLKATDYAELAKVKGNIFLSKDFHPNRESKSWTELTDGMATYGDTVLLSNIKEYSESDRKQHVLWNFLSNVEKSVVFVMRESKRLADMGNLLNVYLPERDRYENANIRYADSSVIRKTLDSGFLKEVDALHVAVDNLTSTGNKYEYDGSSFTKALRVMRGKGIGSDSLKDAVLPVLVELLENAFEEALAAPVADADVA